MNLSSLALRVSKLVLFLILLFKAMDLKAQQPSDSTMSDSSQYFPKIEVAPFYPGGYKGWSRYLVRKLRYPEKAVEKNVQGTVNVQFVVEITGAISEVE